MPKPLKMAPARDLFSTDASRANGCLSEENLLRFAAGRLKAGQLTEAHRHLDQCEICQRLLSEAARAVGTAQTAPVRESQAGWNTSFQPGDLVGARYRIVRFIARGGMGEVYEAFDNELNERVALKTVMSTACDNPNAVRRLKGEVQLARRVSHPNVCRIYDIGSHLSWTGAQISFLTMEFVAGETLGQRVRLGGALPMAEVRELVRQMLLGLVAAHDAGVLHRDFKSDNVILSTDAAGHQTPVIVDFGLARALDNAAYSASNSAPSLVGTFGYIAPEQLQGKVHTTASDVYAFGIVWWELLTGELPFESRASPALAALERLQRDPAAPSKKNSEVSNELDAVVLRCLRRSPKDRFKTAREVLAALECEQVAWRWHARRRWLSRLALAAGFCVCAGYLSMRGHPQTKATTIRPTTPASITDKTLSSTPLLSTDEPSKAKGAPRVPPSSAMTTKPMHVVPRAPVSPTTAGKARASGANVEPKTTAPSSQKPVEDDSGRTPSPPNPDRHRQPQWEPFPFRALHTDAGRL